MTTSTLTISEFLLARIEEDEAVAAAATAGPWGHNPRKEWFTDPDKLRAARAGVLQTGGEEYVYGNGDVAHAVAATGPSDDPRSMADASHIARHDPTRVLAECKAKRAIVESWLEADKMYGGDVGAYMDGVLTALASVYADHEDFRAEWAL